MHFSVTVKDMNGFGWHPLFFFSGWAVGDDLADELRLQVPQHHLSEKDACLAETYMSSNQ